MNEPIVDDDVDDPGQNWTSRGHDAVGCDTFLGLESVDAQCPWCGEWLEWVIDPTSSDAYVEDCYVCCRPCVLRPTVDDQGRITGIGIDCE